MCTPCFSQCSGASAVTPVTVTDETTTGVPSSRQLINGLGTVVNTSTPGQIEIDLSRGLFANLQGGRISIDPNKPVPYDTPLGGTNVYFVPDSGGYVGLYNASNTWVADPIAGSVSVPATTNTIYDIYATDNNGTCTIGTVAWTAAQTFGSSFSGAASTIFSVCAGPDGQIWSTSANNGNPRVAKTTVSGTMTNYNNSGSSQEGGICAGPDGNLYAVDIWGNNIIQITTEGTATYFAITTASSGAKWICLGPDGKLWFTENSVSKIGRTTTGGTMTETATTTASAGPWAICLGPDGNLWFTENSANKIGKITPTGTVTEFSTGLSASAGVQGICAGPDGNLWFCENSTGKIGKITPTGTISEFTGISGASYICAAPDGNLYFTATNAIGKVTTAGTVTSITATIVSGSPICVGPDGQIWFSSSSYNINTMSLQSPPSRGLQDGVLWTGNAHQRLIGCISTGATSGRVPDWARQRFVYNYYNQVVRPISCQIPTNTWTYATAVWRPSDADTNVGEGNCQILQGIGLDVNNVANKVTAPAKVTFTQSVQQTVSANSAVGIGLDNSPIPISFMPTQQFATTTSLSTTLTVTASPMLFPGVHTFQMMEQASGTTTFGGNQSGSTATTVRSSGLSGFVLQ